MRRSVLLGSAALLSVLAGETGGARAQPPSDDEAVRAANAAFYAALSARDIGAVERAWARDEPVSNIFGASRSPALGWDAVGGACADLFARFPELSVSMPEPFVRREKDGALVVGVEALRARLPDGGAVDLSLPTTNVFVRRGGRWLLVHHHSSRPPP